MNTATDKLLWQVVEQLIEALCHKMGGFRFDSR